ncbi:MAG: hypothetical protein ICV79_08890 [Flavisolibacter sp.]|nr:hypothetical protein [Flavisolibacter sp.]
MKPINFRFTLLCTFLLVIVSCNKVHDELHDFLHPKQEPSKKVYVDNVNRLYEVVNDAANAGSIIVLAPGTYPLSPNHPNGGRIELLKDMSLVGQQGHPELVVIDVSALPLSSVLIPSGLGPTIRTGAIRTGNGTNAIEWMTLQSNGTKEDIRSLIQTDIVATQVTKLRVAHTIEQGAGIGINLANRDVTSNGRTIEAEIEDNTVRNNSLLSNGIGIFIQSQGSNDGTIKAVLKGNYIYGNQQGIIVAHSICSNHQISVESHNDRIEENGAGVVLRSLSTRANTPTENNVIRFAAFSTDIRNNRGVPTPVSVPISGGMQIAAGVLDGPATPGTVNNNRVEALFDACRLEGNTGATQITAYGALSTAAGTPPVGSNNTAVIYLKGLSKNTTVNAINSVPPEPAGTNKVVVDRQ